MKSCSSSPGVHPDVVLLSTSNSSPQCSGCGSLSPNQQWLPGEVQGVEIQAGAREHGGASEITWLCFQNMSRCRFTTNCLVPAGEMIVSKTPFTLQDSGKGQWERGYFEKIPTWSQKKAVFLGSLTGNPLPTSLVWFSR